MPRTKRPAARKEKIAEEDVDITKRFNKLANEHKKKIDDRTQMELRNLDLAFKILLDSINKEYLHKTVGQLKNEFHLKEVPTTRVTRHSSRSASHDDGYLTQNSSQDSEGRALRRQIPVAKSSSRPTGNRSRSADPSARKPLTASKTVQRRRSKSVYRTPAFNKNATCNYPAITPKVAPNSALSVLRQPRQGEMVVSMSGSPVMVPSCYTLKPDEKANCNILLQDGTMLSLQPKQLRQSQVYIPFGLMDAGVFDQLKTLKDNLDKVVQLGEKAFK